MSVNTLTTGSQATARLSVPGCVQEGAEAPGCAAWATGTRTSTEVAESPLSCSEIVCIGTAERATVAARSALAARLIVGGGRGRKEDL